MKMNVKKKRKSNILLWLIVIIIVSIFCSFMLIKYFSKNISPFFMTYAEDEIKRMTNLIINYSINNEIVEMFNDEDIFEIVRNNKDEIQLISYNAKYVNMLLNDISMIIQNNLSAIENGELRGLDLLVGSLDDYDLELLKEGIICEIPFGAFLGNSLISNVGPKIPVKFNLLGDVNTDIRTNVKEYGINNALLEVSIEITVNFRVNLPFISNTITVGNVMPISMKIIQGNIPNFYTGGFTSSYSKF